MFRHIDPGYDIERELIYYDISKYMFEGFAFDSDVQIIQLKSNQTLLHNYISVTYVRLVYTNLFSFGCQMSKSLLL